MPLEDFDRLIASATVGDAAALQVLYSAIHPSVLTYTRNRLPPADAEDAAADVFVSVARGLSGFVGGESAFRSWVFTIAHHRVIDHHRTRSKHRIAAASPEEMAAQGASGDSESEAIDLVGTSAALAAIAQLPKAQAAVVLLRVVADLSVGDVAEIVGRNEGAVRALQLRGLRRLGRQLEVAGRTQAPRANRVPSTTVRSG